MNAVELEAVEFIEEFDESEETELTEIEALIELMFSERTTVSEVIAALRDYVTVHGSNLQPLEDVLQPGLANYISYSIDDDFYELADPNLKVSFRSELRPSKKSEDSYVLSSYIQLTESRFHTARVREIILPAQVVAELQNITEPNRLFDSEIIVRLYTEHRDAILNANAAPIVSSLIEAYSIPVNMIAAGMDDAEIAAYFESKRSQRNASNSEEAVVVETDAPRPRP